MGPYSPSVGNNDKNLSSGAIEPFWFGFKVNITVKVEVSSRYIRKLNFYQPAQHNKTQ